ncbi:hypothetical protein [Shewanella litorisediminis]|uniref:Secreted protein n=1 Tax=Shewanella litorisediminis TaxID=1173586 RepID=A0ABX7G3G8_9GAMM|nr:hypothetical protein [Shewanella litorisediminis]MCL2919936.1 hypothetical protein [Shewanella litorisediminis]QRH01877.1 hypothetical protein JQC75_00025 [Shewanella litorisediminis]
MQLFKKSIPYLLCLGVGVISGLMIHDEGASAQPVDHPNIVLTADTAAGGSVATITDHATTGEHCTEAAMPTPENDDSQHIASLRQTIAALESENDYLKDALNNAVSAAKEQGISAVNADNDQDNTSATISVEDVQRHMPAPFADLIANRKGMIAELFNKLQAEPKDDDWAVVMEQQISDFILTHARSGEVDIQAINCKKTTCEIRAFEVTSNGWDKIYEEMMREPWWVFRSTAASFGKSTEHGDYFYLVVSG